MSYLKLDSKYKNGGATSRPSLTHLDAEHCSFAVFKHDLSAKQTQFRGSSRTSPTSAGQYKQIRSVFFLVSFYVCGIQPGRSQSSLEPEMLTKACIYASLRLLCCMGIEILIGVDDRLANHGCVVVAERVSSVFNVDIYGFLHDLNSSLSTTWFVTGSLSEW
jgi:hypothetical protein